MDFTRTAQIYANTNRLYKQTSKHSSEMRTDRSSPYEKSLWGVSLTETSPGQRPLLNRDPMEGTRFSWDQAVRQEVTSYRDPSPVNRMTHASENITFPQTSFVGGNKYPRIIANSLLAIYQVLIQSRSCLGAGSSLC